MFCSNCGAQIDEKAAVCINCGAAVKNTRSDNAGAGWWWLGFLIPIAGLFIWIFCNDSEPNKARKAGWGALVGVIVSTVLTLFIVLSFLTGISFLFMAI